MNESHVEAAAIEWFQELGYAFVPGPGIAPGDLAAQRESFADVVLAGRLREAVERLNPQVLMETQGRRCARCCASNRSQSRLPVEQSSRRPR
jgi:type I restriction enzyme, R subunit